MFAKKLALAALLVATATGFAGAADLPVKAAKAPPPIPFFFVNDNALSFWYEFTATDPRTSTTAKKVINFTHFDVWAYGTNFFTISGLRSDNRDPSAPCSFVTGNAGCEGATEIYGLVRDTFGWNELFNTKAFKMGPLADISFIVGGDANSENTYLAPAKRDLVGGIDFTFTLPYNGHFDVAPLVYKEWNHNGYTQTAAGNGGFPVPGGSVEYNATWAVETVYAMPLGFLPPWLPLTFGGYANFYGPKGTGCGCDPGGLLTGNTTKTEIHTEQRLTLDVGKLTVNKAGMYSVFVGYRYWKNKFGLDASLPINSFSTESTWLTGVSAAF
jgi:hypothetical protein